MHFFLDEALLTVDGARKARAFFSLSDPPLSECKVRPQDVFH